MPLVNSVSLVSINLSQVLSEFKLEIESRGHSNGLGKVTMKSRKLLYMLKSCSEGVWREVL